MKKLLISTVFFILILTSGKTQTTDDVLNLLIQRNLISQQEADSLRVDAAQKQQDAIAKKKSFPVTAGKAIQLAGYTQVRYQEQDEPGKIDGFDIRRAYFDLKGNLSPYWSYRLQVDFASLKLMDAYSELKLNDYFNFTLGQFTLPFSHENITSNTKLDLIERSQVVESLVARSKDVIGGGTNNYNGRDIGVQLGGTLLKLNDNPFLEYKIGLFNGSGINQADKNESKDVVSRIVVYPVIAGLSIGGSYYNGFGNFGTPAKNRKRNRMGFELNYELNTISLRSEYIKGWDSGIERDGYYVQAGYYIIPQTFQFVARLDSYDPDKSKNKDAGNWYIAGLNYSFNPNVRLQVNYTFKQEEGTSINNNLASVQLQYSF